MKILPCIDAMLSDHCTLLFKVQIRKPPPVLKKVAYRPLKVIDLDAFRLDIMESALFTESHSDLSGLIQCYNDSLSTALDFHAPVIEKEIPERPRQPWYNNAIRSEKRIRRRCERQWKKDKSQINEEILRHQKTKVNILINSTRSEFYSKKIEDCGNDQKQTFNIVKGLFHKNGDIPYPEHNSLGELTEDFAEFFITKIELIRTKLDSVAVEPPQEQPCHSVFESFRPLTLDEVRKLVVKSPCKSCSLDPIPTDLLRKCLDLLLPVIQDIINRSLSTGTFPDEYKLALVTPLLKRLGLELIFPSYRPVSNLQFLSKLTERAVATQFVDYVKDNGLKELMQSAYSEFHSTETALIKVHNDIMLAMDNQKVVLLLLLDLSAASDTVDHGILLSRHKTRFGVNGIALQWFESYLTGRSQAVTVQGSRSSNKPLQFGVPQGSVLGPILFCAYTAPLGDLLRSHGVDFHFYADDSQVGLTFSPDILVDQIDAFDQIESCAASVRQWMLQNKLKLNDDKTVFMVLGNKPQLKKLVFDSVIIGDSYIESSEKCVNLGAGFDSDMTMKHHVNLVCKSGYYHLRNISRIKKCLNSRALETVIHAFHIIKVGLL